MRRPGGRSVRLAAAAVAVLCALGAAAACSDFSGSEAPLAEAGAGDEDSNPPTPDGSPAGEGGIDAAADAQPDVLVGLKTGCSDGTREGFLGDGDVGIAACRGQWGTPGIRVDDAPGCGRRAGNDGDAGVATTCTAQDLCASGWHVCASAFEVSGNGGAVDGGPCSGRQPLNGVTFYATAQPGSGGTNCGGGNNAANDVFGCGDFPSAPGTGCAPLNATISTDNKPVAFTFAGDNSHERDTVLKGTGPGGVLCCTGP